MLTPEHIKEHIVRLENQIKGLTERAIMTRGALENARYMLAKMTEPPDNAITE